MAAAAAVGAGGAFLPGGSEKRQTASPYSSPVMVALKSTKIRPDLASSDTFVLEKTCTMLAQVASLTCMHRDTYR